MASYLASPGPQWAGDTEGSGQGPGSHQPSLPCKEGSTHGSPKARPGRALPLPPLGVGQAVGLREPAERAVPGARWSRGAHAGHGASMDQVGRGVEGLWG